MLARNAVAVVAATLVGAVAMRAPVWSRPTSPLRSCHHRRSTPDRTVRDT